MSENNGTKRERWSREAVAGKLAQYEQKRQCATSQREATEGIDVPRSTLQHWLKRKSAIDAEPELVAFFEPPTGVAFLHRLVLRVRRGPMLWQRQRQACL